MSIRTPLAKAKGTGSAHEGTHHWWMQRVSAIALIGLTVWIVYLLSMSFHGSNVAELLRRPANAVGFLLFITVALYHGAIGMRVVIEDYVHCPYFKHTLIIGTNFLAIVTAVAVVLAIFYAHIGGAQHGRGYSKYGKYNKEYCHKTGQPGMDGYCQPRKGKRGEYRKHRKSGKEGQLPSSLEPQTERQVETRSGIVTIEEGVPGQDPPIVPDAVIEHVEPEEEMLPPQE